MGEKAEKKNRKKNFIWATVIGVAVVAVLIVGSVVYFKKNEIPEVQYAHASWTYGYTGIEDLTTASDLIALVKVKGLNRTKDNGVPMSYFEVEVTEAVSGCTEGDTIIVCMTGVKNREEHIEIQDDPLINIGEEYLIFTRKNETGTYTILGGPQGRFLYENGKVTSQLYLNEVNNTGVQAVKEVEEGKYQGLIQIYDKDVAEILEETREYLQ